MDYKKIIRSRAARQKILRMLEFIPDEPMLRMQYRLKTGRRLDLKDPKRYTEKMQWYKLHYKDPLLIRCVDKGDVRDYVKEKGLEELLIPCFGIYEDPAQIDWKALPERFVMKDTLGGAGNSVVIVTEKSAADLEELKKKARSWTDRDVHHRTGGREWPYYSGRDPRVIIEDYLESDPAAGGLIDYKFVCFNGKTAVIFVLADREMGQAAGCGIFDPDMNLLPVVELGERRLERTIAKPPNFEQMKAIAEKLAEDFPQVRVDLYNLNGEIRFGELTFYDTSGYMTYDPDSFDLELGAKWNLPC